MAKFKGTVQMPKLSHLYVIEEKLPVLSMSKGATGKVQGNDSFSPSHQINCGNNKNQAPLLCKSCAKIHSSSIFLNFILFFNFTILYWFCHKSKWIRHRYTCVPHPEPSSLLPPHSIPLGRPSAPAPSMQYRALNVDWRLDIFKNLFIWLCWVLVEACRI